MKEICPKELCTGCTACESICAHNAIKMYVDNVGFTFPEIDIDNCVGCGLCQRVCPIINDVSQRTPISSWVALASDNEEQLTSTSGGLASALARYIIKYRHGVVYGCSGEDCYHVSHIRVNNENDLHKLKGSKYVQSDIRGIYSSVKKDLLSAKIVLFIGTPCQNAGLKMFLHKNYNNLICVDFVCHGVPSQKMLSDHINELGFKNRASYATFRFKQKSKGSRYMLTITDKYNSVLYKKPYGVDFYMSGFILGLFYRESCYSCKFATPNRVSDLTIGDFWDNSKEYCELNDNGYGLSQLHINTEKGEQLISDISNAIICEPIEFQKLLKHSLQLKEPMKRHKNYELFQSLYQTTGFRNACKLAMSSDYSAFRKQRILDIVFLIPGTQYIYKIIKGK